MNKKTGLLVAGLGGLYALWTGAKAIAYSEPDSKMISGYFSG